MNFGNKNSGYEQIRFAEEARSIESYHISAYYQYAFVLASELNKKEQRHFTSRRKGG